jgi:hypothetical protein
LGSATLDCCFDDFAIRLSGQGTCTPLTTGTGCSSYSVEVDFMRLRGFIVDDCIDAFDIKTSRGQICGEKE